MISVAQKVLICLSKSQDKIIDLLCTVKLLHSFILYTQKREENSATYMHDTYPHEAIMEEQPNQLCGQFGVYCDILSNNICNDLLCFGTAFVIEVHFQTFSLRFYIATKEQHAQYQCHNKAIPHFEYKTIIKQFEVQTLKKENTLKFIGMVSQLLPFYRMIWCHWH
jgi:hypothetical protein